MTIAMMAMERLNSISRPLSPHSRLSMRRALVISTLIWIYSLIFSTPPVFQLFNRYVPEGYLTSCSFDYLSKDLVSRVYIFAFFTAAWIVPLTMIVTSYAGIIIAVERNETMFQKTQDKLCERASSVYRASLRDSRGRSIKESGKMEMRLVKIVLSLIAFWILSWTPYAVIALLGLLDQSYITPTSSMIPSLFAKLSSVVNPYLYGLGNPRFKREFKRKLCSFCLNTKMATERRTVIQSTATLGGDLVKEESQFVHISEGNLSEIELSDYEKR